MIRRSGMRSSQMARQKGATGCESRRWTSIARPIAQIQMDRRRDRNEETERNIEKLGREKERQKEKHEGGRGRREREEGDNSGRLALVNSKVGGGGGKSSEKSFPTVLPSVGRGSSPSALRSTERKYRILERRRGCAARCVSDVICGCHGDAIDWPTRRQTSRESRRHSDYCPPLAPLGPSRTDRHPLLSLALSTTLIRFNVLAHDAIRLHVRRHADTRARDPRKCDAYTHMFV